MKAIRSAFVSLSVLAGLALSGCGGLSLDNSERLLVIGAAGTSFTRYSTLTYDQIGGVTNITGLVSGDTIEAVDVRPATGVLYGMSQNGRLYSINFSTGAATQVGSQLTFTGSVADIDFNPTADRIRFVTSTEESYRINPTTGALVATDTNLAYAAGDVNNGTAMNMMGAAYTNNTSTSTVTTLMGLEAAVDTLCRIGSVDGSPDLPNTGKVNTVAATSINLSGDIGFDISGDTGIGFALSNDNLYTVNLNNGNMIVRLTGVSANDVCVLP
jgi:hypothetical protein